MAKTNTPFFGLASQGSVGQVLTSQKRDSSTLLRKKPLPGYRYTLPQAYQRWLYEDYAYLWTQQSTATRAEYRAGGSRFHLTGFQYWMKVMLSTLPDIAAWWKLDEKSGAIAHDSGKNTNNGTIVGASPTTGLISGAQFHDGINDRIDCGDGISLDLTSVMTIEALVLTETIAEHNIIACRYDSIADNFLFWQAAGGFVQFYIWSGGVIKVVTSTNPIAIDTWYHILATYDGANLRLFFDGVEAGPPTPFVGLIDNNDVSFTIGARSGVPLWWWDGLIDNVILNNRALDTTEILRHSLRRYPPQ